MCIKQDEVVMLVNTTICIAPLVTGHFYIYRVLRSRHDELEVGDVVKEVTEVD